MNYLLLHSLPSQSRTQLYTTLFTARRPALAHPCEAYLPHLNCLKVYVATLAQKLVLEKGRLSPSPCNLGSKQNEDSNGIWLLKRHTLFEIRNAGSSPHSTCTWQVLLQLACSNRTRLLSCCIGSWVSSLQRPLQQGSVDATVPSLLQMLRDFVKSHLSLFPHVFDLGWPKPPQHLCLCQIQKWSQFQSRCWTNLMLNHWTQRSHPSCLRVLHPMVSARRQANHLWL